MNKRPLPSTGLGLPAKPYIPPQPGPAPPLPPGPPPPQPQQQAAYSGPQDPQQAAHAAAWAAYYQSQGVGVAGSTYPNTTPAAGTAGPTNPYANYGYGAGAQHANFQPQQPQHQPQPQAYRQGYQPPVQQPAQPQAGPSQSPYRPGGSTPGYGGYTAPAYGTQGYGQGASPAGQQRPPVQSQPQLPPQAPGGYQGWSAGQPQANPLPAQNQNQPYRPPGQFNQPQPFQPPQQPHPQSFSSPGAQHPPFRPPTNPVRPFQASPVRPPSRPPVQAGPGGQGGFPPAKRPRFDGPGPGPGPSGPPSRPGGNMGIGMGMGMGNGMQNVPVRPNQPSARPLPFGPSGGGAGGINNGQPGFAPVRPSTGPGPGLMGPSGGGNIVLGGNVGRGAPPVQRPPIHLGMGGPPPGIIRGGIPLRGGLAARGRGGGVINAPRGPSGVSGMRRDARPGSSRPSGPGGGAAAGKGGVESEKDRKEREKRKREREREREAKTTMTDFRIVGIEMKELGWSWGLIGEAARAHNEEVEKKRKASTEVKAEHGQGGEDVEAEEGMKMEKKNGHSNVEGTEDVAAEAPVKKEANGGADVKKEPAGEHAVGAENAELAEAESEKRGEKRKAKTPDGEDEGASKKRANYILTHGKPNETVPESTPSEGKASTESEVKDVSDVRAHEREQREEQPSKFENNQNRFRIYFESPPELDRIPKAVRRGNKRWRRETSSVAPSRMGEERERDREVQAEDGVLAEDGVEETVEEIVEEYEGQGGGGEEVLTGESQEGGIGASTEEEAVVDGSGVAGSAQLGLAQQPIEPGHYATDSPSAEAPSATTLDASQGDSITEPPPDSAQGRPDTTEAADAGDGDDHPEHEGDVSMMTDPAAVPAMLAELDQAEAAIDAGPGAAGVPHVEAGMTPATTSEGNDPQDNATEEPTVTGQATAEEALPAPAEHADETTAAEHNAEVVGGKATPETAAELEAALAKSAENMASAYKSRARRRSSVSTVHSRDYEASVAGGTGSATGKEGVPSMNRISVLYEESSRRICLDARAVRKVRVYRGEGKIEVVLVREVEKVEKEKVENDEGYMTDKGKGDLPKGVLIEMYDPIDQRFVAVPRQQLEELWSSDAEDVATLPPFHRAFKLTPCPSSVTNTNGAVPVEADPPAARPSAEDEKHEHEEESLTLIVYLNKKRPLSEPKWCRTNSADEWLYETFGSRKGFSETGWRGKLEIVDPDPSPTLQSILDSWASSSSAGNPFDRRSFVASLVSDPLDLLEILLRLTRGDRNPTASQPGQGFGALASAIRPDSPYASHQTHVSLAILAMYRLTTDYAAKAGEAEGVKEKVSDIVRSLPVGMITRSLDGLFREWEGR